MNNYSNMSGLDLFTDPFSRPQAYSQPPVRSTSTVASHPKTAATQTPPDRQVAQPTQPKPVAAQVQQPDTVAKPVTEIEAPAPQENVKASVPEPVKEQEQKPTATKTAPTKESTPIDTQPEPPKKALELDMSTGAGTSRKIPDEDDAAKRKAHEEAEAKRKAAWEAKQAEKRKAEEEALQKLQNMSDDDVIAASVERVGEEIERITHRNMKECVAEHIQELARKDPDFARKIMNPLAHKSMANCFRFINMKAKDFIQKMMEDNDLRPDRNGMFGESVPDNIVYQWAEDYINSTDVSEDAIKEEKFVPRPYVGKTSKPKKTTTKAKKSEKPAAKETAKNQEPKDNFEQMSLFEKGGENP